MYRRRIFCPAHGYALFIGKSLLHCVQALAKPTHRLLRVRAILTGMLAGLFFRPRSGMLEPPPAAAPQASPRTRHTPLATI
jgi:hypothetical protein